MKKPLSLIAIIILLLTGFSTVIQAQDFLPAYDRFSGKEPVYITLEDGTQLVGTLEGVNRKKNQIESVSFKDSVGNPKKFSADEIKSAYLRPSDYSKMMTDVMNVEKVQTWDNTYIRNDLIAQGYCYFEKAKVDIKGETSTLLLQLLNPGFSSKIKVFYDPYASETGGIGYAGLKLTGGEDKSYYVQVGDKVARKTKKKDYDSLYKEFYSGCSELLQKLEKDHKWSDFAKHIYAFTFECK